MEPGVNPSDRDPGLTSFSDGFGDSGRVTLRMAALSVVVTVSNCTKGLFGECGCVGGCDC